MRLMQRATMKKFCCAFLALVMVIGLTPITAPKAHADDVVTLSGTVNASSLGTGHEYRVKPGTKIVLADSDNVAIDKITSDGVNASLTIMGSNTGQLTVKDGIELGQSDNVLKVEGGTVQVNRNVSASSWNYAIIAQSYEQTGGIVTASINNTGGGYNLAVSTPTNFAMSGGELNCNATTIGSGSSWGIKTREDCTISGGTITCNVESPGNSHGIQFARANITGGTFNITAKSTGDYSTSYGIYTYADSTQAFKMQNATMSIISNNTGDTAYGINTNSLGATVTNCAITATVTAKRYAYGLIPQKGVNLNISGGSLDISAKAEEGSYGIYSYENISFADGCTSTINSESTGGELIGDVSYGILMHKDFSVSGSGTSVTANAKGNKAYDVVGIFATSSDPHNWNITGGSTVTGTTESSSSGTSGLYGILCDLGGSSSKVTVDNSTLNATCNTPYEYAYGAAFSPTVVISGASTIDMVAHGSTQATGIRTSRELTLAEDEVNLHAKATVTSGSDTYAVWASIGLNMGNQRITQPTGGFYQQPMIKDPSTGLAAGEVKIEPPEKRKLYVTTYNLVANEPNNQYGNSNDLLITSDRSGDSPAPVTYADGGRVYEVSEGKTITVTASVNGNYYEFVGWRITNKNGAFLSSSPSYTYTMGAGDYVLCAMFDRKCESISSVALTTNITKIGAGEHAADPTVNLASELSDKVTLNSATWYDAATNTPETGSFAPGNTYLLRVSLQPKDGYKWDAGGVTVTLNGKNMTETSLKGTFAKAYVVGGTDIGPATVLGIGNKTYAGSAFTPTPVVKLGSDTLVKGTDYTVSYQDNINAGTAKVIITGTGEYGGSIVETFTISPAKVPIPAGKVLPYNGKAQTGVAASAFYTITGNTATNVGSYTATLKLNSTTNLTWADGSTANKQVSWRIEATGVPMYRMYNKWSGEHLFTANKSELDKSVKLGWTNEGVAWQAPSAGEPVYRLYNKWSGDHHYTRDKTEYNQCIKGGWKGEGIVFYSGGDQKVYRLYNKYVQQFFHHYTMDLKEYKQCKANGWKDEGIGWYGYSA